MPPRMPSRQRAITLKIRRPESASAKLPAGPTPNRYDQEGEKLPAQRDSEDQDDAAGQAEQDEANDDDDDEDEDENEDEDDEQGSEDSEASREDPTDSGDSEDEWKPEDVKGQAQKRSFLGVEGDSESSGPEIETEPEDDLVDKSPSRKTKPSEKQSSKRPGKRKKLSTKPNEGVPDFDQQDPELVPVTTKSKRPLRLTEPTVPIAPVKTPKSFIEEQLQKVDKENQKREKRQANEDAKELLEAEKAAAAAWAAVRAKQAASAPSQEASTSSSAPSSEPQKTKSAPASAATGTLSSWLGLAPKVSDVPNPTSCPAAQIADRDSLFIGYVYPLESNSPHVLSSILNHLNKVIHPNHTPVDLLPPNLRSAAPSKRGSTHDMYALRVLQLKPGRSGTSGPDEFAIVEENEDDGEKWGSKNILKVMAEEGAIDCICIVSRWFGGSMLGPDRFQHITDVARAAVRKYLEQEKMRPILDELRELDAEIHGLKSKASPEKPMPAPPPYEEFDLTKLERLLNARRQQLKFLQKSSQSSA